MIEINLLPWRKQKKLTKEKRIANFFLLTIAISIAMFFISWLVLSTILNKMSDEVSSLKEKNEDLLQVTNHIASPKPPLMELVKLLERQMDHYHLFLQMAKKIPEICFSTVKYQNNEIIFEGHVLSAISFTEFMLKWPAVNLFSNIKINELKKNATSDQIDFKFSAIL